MHDIPVVSHSHSVDATKSTERTVKRIQFNDLYHDFIEIELEKCLPFVIFTLIAQVKWDANCHQIRSILRLKYYVLSEMCTRAVSHGMEIAIGRQFVFFFSFILCVINYEFWYEHFKVSMLFWIYIVIEIFVFFWKLNEANKHIDPHTQKTEYINETNFNLLNNLSWNWNSLCNQKVANSKTRSEKRNLKHFDGF